MSVAHDERTQPHDHIVGFYVRDEELTGAVAGFLTDAFDNNGAAIVIATEAHRLAFADALSRSGCSPDDLERNGRYRALDAELTLAQFMRDGRPDPKAFVATIAPVLAACAFPGAPVHAFGEMVGLLWDAGNVAAAIDLEAMWNDLASAHEFTLFCAYDMSSIEQADDLGAARQICEQHSNVIALHDQLARTPERATSEDPDEFERLFIRTPSAPIRVRSFVREALRAWDQETSFAVVGLVAAELATNAMVHARSPFRVALTRSPDTIRIAVRDTSTDTPEQLGRDRHRTGGRGIAIVAALSRAWGTEQDPRGKVVWAEIARDAAPAAG